MTHGAKSQRRPVITSSATVMDVASVVESARMLSTARRPWLIYEDGDEGRPRERLPEE